MSDAEKIVAEIEARIDQFGYEVENAGLEWRSPKDDDIAKKLYDSCHACINDIRVIADRLSPATARKLAAFEKIKKRVAKHDWLNIGRDIERIIAEAERSE